jgi:hypothetical protein
MLAKMFRWEAVHTRMKLGVPVDMTVGDASDNVSSLIFFKNKLSIMPQLCAEWEPTLVFTPCQRCRNFSQMSYVSMPKWYTLCLALRLTSVLQLIRGEHKRIAHLVSDQTPSMRHFRTLCSSWVFYLITLIVLSHCLHAAVSKGRSAFCSHSTHNSSAHRIYFVGIKLTVLI